MKVKIYRYDPKKDKDQYYDEFKIELGKENITVMDLLDKISLEKDPSIAYYKHSVCNHGICGRCTLMVNDIPKLACTCTINGYKEIKLDPMKNRKVIKDLVTEPI